MGGKGGGNENAEDGNRSRAHEENGSKKRSTGLLRV